MRQALAVFLLLLFTVENVASAATFSEAARNSGTRSIAIQQQSQPGFVVLAEQNEERDLKDDGTLENAEVLTNPVIHISNTVGKIQIPTETPNPFGSVPLYQYICLLLL